MFFVEARYHREARRVGAQLRYIAHREEGLTDGRRRELYGIGDRYRAMKGDERAIRKALREDARGLRNPVYFRFILTVDNAAAERFRRLDGSFCDRVLRDAVEKTFRGAARGAQGVFAIHQHGGVDRPAHPHVHALLGPRFENGMAVHLSPLRIQRVRERGSGRSWSASSVRNADWIARETPLRRRRFLAGESAMTNDSTRYCP